MLRGTRVLPQHTVSQKQKLNKIQVQQRAKFSQMTLVSSCMCHYKQYDLKV